MKKFKALLFTFLVIIIISSSCEKKEDETIDKETVNQLSKSWTHSFEEDESNLEQIFRPSDSKVFPAVMFRQKYILNTDYTCEYLVLSPVDAHHMSDGKWSLNNTELITITDLANTTISKIKIVELTNDILKVEKIN